VEILHDEASLQYGLDACPERIPSRIIGRGDLQGLNCFQMDLQHPHMPHSRFKQIMAGRVLTRPAIGREEGCVALPPSCACFARHPRRRACRTSLVRAFRPCPSAYFSLRLEALATPFCHITRQWGKCSQAP